MVRSPTFPIFRSAWVLEADRPVTAHESIEVGRLLAASSADLISKLIERLATTASNQLTLVNRARGDGPDAPNVRFDPAIVVDFPIIQFLWREKLVEARFQITSWMGNRKAKLWTRMNFCESVSDAHLIKDFFDDMHKLSASMSDLALNHYNNLVSTKLGMSLRAIYEIWIHMISSPSTELRDTIQRRERFQPASDTPTLGDTLKKVLSTEFNISLPKKTTTTKRYIRSLAYPLTNVEVMKERHRLEAPGLDEAEIEKIVLNEVDELRCIAAIDTTSKRCEVWGVVYERTPMRGERATGPLIVSGEIAIRLGDFY